MRTKNMLTTKTRKCRACGAIYTQYQSFVTWCSPECGAEIAAKKIEKMKREEAVKVRRADKVKREKLKTRADYIREAQIEFNKYVRLRDSGKGCISCGSACGEGSIGGSGDAGHFRSRGSAPHLRFDERNCHLQCKRCNRYLSGNVADYRVGLVRRIGLDVVLALEEDQEPRKYTVDELKAIKKHYAELAKELRIKE